MRYWESSRQRSSSSRRKPPTRRSSIASGGSVRQYPFLRRFYQHQAAISDNFQKFLFFLILAVLIYAFVIGDGGAIKIISLKRQKAALEKDVAMLKVNTEELQAEIDRLKADPFIMEKLGRERYGYVYPGDRVYRIVPTTEEK